MHARAEAALMCVETVLLALGVIVLPVLALAFYVVHRIRPGRFRLSVKLLKLLDIGIEVDAQDKQGELLGNRPQL